MRNKLTISIICGLLAANFAFAQDVATLAAQRRSIWVDDYAQYLPGLAYIGFTFTEPDLKNELVDRGLTAGVAFISEAILVNAIKYTVREERPDHSAFNSFPSGHTATAFTGAELVRMEYGWGYGALAYGIASGVGYLRVYKYRHWTHDVFAGAAIGILSAHIGDWLLPTTRGAVDRWFGKDVQIAVAPAYDYMTGAAGAAVCLKF